MGEPLPARAVFRRTITVPPEAIDANGHVNNVVYVQWMQDLAVEHYAAMGGPVAHGADCTWVASEHRVRYLVPALEGEEIEAQTWVENCRRVRSRRCYRFVRKADGRELVRGETEWAFVDAATGAPRPVPPEVARLLSGAD